MKILIKLGNSIKLKEGKSLFISFSYNPDIISKIKSLDTRYYIPDTKEWEISISSFDVAKDLLGDYEFEFSNFNPDEIIKKEQSNGILVKTISADELENKHFKLIPYPYQLEGIKYGLNNDKFLLGDEQGLGKTKQTIELAVLRKEEIKRCLIICGINGLKYNWLNEIQKHTDEKVRILGSRINSKGKMVDGSTKQKLEHIQNLGDEFFLITNIETMRNEEIRDELSKQINYNKNIGMVVIDEAHMVKNIKASQSFNIHWLKPKYKIAITGTPLINKPEDLYNIMKWLEVERGKLRDFKERYCDMDSFGQITGYKNLDELKNRLSKIMIRRRKNEVLDLPPKIFSNVYVELKGEQLKQYEQLRKGLLLILNDKKIKAKELKLAIQQLHYSRQIASFLEDTEHDKNNPKYNRTKEIVEEVVGNDGKVIVFTNWKKVVDSLSNVLSDYAPVCVTGDLNTSERNKAIDNFQNNKDCKVIIGTIDALGTGYTLTAANTVIFIDNPWTAAKKAQAEDRAHRIGTTDSVNIITLLSKDTIDEKIHELLEKKAKMADSIVNGSDEDFVNRLDVETLKWLFD